MQHGYVPAPWSIYAGIQKLPPGTIASVSVDTARPGEIPAAAPSWSLTQVHREHTVFSDAETVISELEPLLEEVVRLRMMADVPLGAFLSGGIDSSLVVALMQRQASAAVKTFSIGFGEVEYDEAPYARAVANHLGTDHTELHVSAADAAQLVPRLQEISDEPFGDPSIIPTFLVCQLARTKVTVALSGDGGDELFGGYDRYLLLGKVEALRRTMPRGIRHVLTRLGRFVPLAQIDPIQKFLREIGLFPFQLNQPGEKLRRMIGLLDAATAQDLYYRAIRHWPDGSAVVEGVGRRVEAAQLPMQGDFRSYMALCDKALYLPDDILTKVDRASMACSLEARVPLLDHRLVEFAARIPAAIQYRDGRGKWPLRQLLSKFIPVEMIDRPKRGFSVPLDNWLRSSLREWGGDLLAEEALKRVGILNPAPIVKAWDEHLSGRRSHGQQLWNALMLQAWALSQ
jgi:asparagine synthase (glutamine-hydrolysing)